MLDLSTLIRGRVLSKEGIPIRKLTSLIGKITATTDVLFPARLHSCALLRDKNIGLKKQGWNGIIELSPESITQLEWWIKNLPLYHLFYQKLFFMVVAD
ncbi:hypothetical protein C1646_685227 [Rhizophagus diaphanus]|nr:hypothetical protein C1646_685227 [Rhizophagus diaphanus] [Rhizophagus sp. MUCL 43196]